MHTFGHGPVLTFTRRLWPFGPIQWYLVALGKSNQSSGCENVSPVDSVRVGSMHLGTCTSFRSFSNKTLGSI